MKKILAGGLASFLALAMFPALSFASSAETAKVIRPDKERNDLLIERQDGQLWILQHNPLCSTMTTEFPVNLILENGKITQLKVAPNEICKVYNAFPLSGEAVLAARVLSDNQLRPEHQVEIVWAGKRTRIDYGIGCGALRNFVGQKVYLSLTGNMLKGGKLMLPSNNGQCSIDEATELGVEDAPVLNAPAKLTGVDFQARNNEVYFHWDAAKGDKPLYLVSYSKFPVKTELYPWKSMPNLKITKENSFLAKQLANGMKYYFYLATVSVDNVVGPWTEVIAIPVGAGGLKNNPDPEPFEVSMLKSTDSFQMAWPAKEEARKFRVSLYVGGKFVFSKLVLGSVSEYGFSDKPEYKGKGMRFTVRSLPRQTFSPTYFDGIYWENKVTK
ncbi:hypothetical protein HZA44_04300 [Candidatus Peregrinibacteria bacterium]|nr:hypothetical protein [Candidatus Peregrinibacteria bacterium]